jgi:Holliday junction DNA helicase RuvA
MITFLEGELVEKQPMRVVLALNGVGYEVSIPLSSFDKLPREKEKCRLLIHDHIREDLHTLYGFCTEDERKTFVLLMTISGIGPKIALSALSGLSVRQMRAAIMGGDAQRLSSVPGIGKKTAERIIVELRDKIGAGEAAEAMIGGDDGRLAGNTEARDAVLALISLGYKQNDARLMIEKTLAAAGSSAKADELIRKALAQG